MYFIILLGLPIASSGLKDQLTRPTGLEFIIPSEEIAVATKTEKLPFTLIVKSFGPSTQYLPLLKEGVASIKSVFDMAGLKNQPQLLSTLSTLNETMNHLNSLKSLIDLIHNYSNPIDQTFMKHPCTVTITGDFSLENLQDIIGSLKALQLGIDLAWTSTNLLDPLKGGSSLLSYVHDSQNLVHDVKEKAINQLIKLDALSRNEIPDDVPALMQTQLCYPDAQQEKVELIDCFKIAAGLACNFEIEIYLTTQTYTVFKPINYGSTELEIDHGLLAKQQGSAELGLLNCTAPIPSKIRVCKYSAWKNDCAKSLEEKDYATTVENCNFTIKAPTNFRVLNGGILIQNPKAIIRIEDRPTDFRTLENRSPMLIFSKYAVTLSEDQEETRFIPDHLETEYGLIYSLFEKEIIENIIAKGRATLMDYQFWIDIVTYVLVSLQTVIIPFAIASFVTACKQQKQQRFHIIRQRKNGQGKDRKGNYQENKQYLRNNREGLELS